MKNVLLYNSLGLVYLLCTLLYLLHVLFKGQKAGRAATALTWVACAIHFVAFITRWIESYQLGIGHLPIRGPYECLVFSGGIMVLFYLVIEKKIKIKTFGALILPVVTLMMIYGSFSGKIDNKIYPMPEVLQGNYINYHLSSCFIGYGAFAVSFVASVLFLLISYGVVTSDNVFKKLYMAPDVLDDISYRMIAIGFIMFSILIITGMFRSKIIWGSYWQWDPVQTWSLLAWLVYANALHGRYMWKWRGGLTAIHSIIGFGLSIVSFLIGAGLINISGHFPITGNS